MLDYSAVIGGFVLRGPGGRFVALNGLEIARDLSKIVPRLASADFRALDPLVVETRPGPMVLVLHPGERAHAYFLLDTTVAGTRRTIRVFQNTEDVVHDALDANLLPVLDLDELRRGIVASRRRHSPISLRVHHLVLRANSPADWTRAIFDVFAANVDAEGNKTALLEERLATLRREVRSTMFKRYLTQCVWFDPASDALGRITASRVDLDEEEHYGFSAFAGGDAAMTDFVNSLAKGSDGRLISGGGFANVLPTPIAGREWLSPTLHVHDESYRDRFGFEEYYSLYRGLEALCQLGAPVRVYDREQVESSIPVRLLRPANKGGPLVMASVRDFTTRGLVRPKAPRQPPSLG